MRSAPQSLRAGKLSENLFLCRPGWSEVLAAEMFRSSPRLAPEILSDSWVALPTGEVEPEQDLAAPRLAFARQYLPDSVAVEAESISRWSDAICNQVVSRLASHLRPWRLHVFQADDPKLPVSRRRCTHIREAVVAEIKQRRRKLWKQWQPDDLPNWVSGEALVQVALFSPTTGWFSLCREEQRLRLGHRVSRFSGGEVVIADDRRAPSQAHRKLREVELRMARPIEPGEFCVDLGGSPGGWSWVALERGAVVETVDRSPLRQDLMQHPRLSYHRGDAFAYQPRQAVDWLLCDVIAFPDRTLDLLTRWLTRGWCRRFCVTIKFRGRDDDALLEEFKSVLSSQTLDFGLRQLDSNRNEVTAFGVARNSEEPSLAV